MSIVEPGVMAEHADQDGEEAVGQAGQLTELVPVTTSPQPVAIYRGVIVFVLYKTDARPIMVKRQIKLGRKRKSGSRESKEEKGNILRMFQSDKRLNIPKYILI